MHIKFWTRAKTVIAAGTLLLGAIGTASAASKPWTPGYDLFTEPLDYTKGGVQWDVNQPSRQLTINFKLRDAKPTKLYQVGVALFQPCPPAGVLFGQFPTGPGGCREITRQGVTKGSNSVELGAVLTDAFGNGDLEVVVGPIEPGTYQLEFFARNGAGCNLAGGGGSGTCRVDFQSPGPSYGDAVKITIAGGALAIATGSRHTCGVTADGAAKCWGDNPYGGLGDGTTARRSVPVFVRGLRSEVTAITAGAFHTCALNAAGSVKCWGYNFSGELGDGSTANRLTPVQVIGLDTGVIAIAAGSEHTCALTVAGGVKCWGWNRFGQIGDGTAEDRWTPVDVVGLTSGVQAIAAGLNHTCALTNAGGVKCWGRNAEGQLGDGTTRRGTTSANVDGLQSGVTAITAGLVHTCALIENGRVKCWGGNIAGELGDGSTTGRLTPVQVNGLTTVTAIAPAGGASNCALMATGRIKCWGNNSHGQLGDGTKTNRLIPVPVAGTYTAIAAGARHTCGLSGDGPAACWGWNHSGQIGDGTNNDSLTPTEVKDF